MSIEAMVDGSQDPVESDGDLAVMCPVTPEMLTMMENTVAAMPVPEFTNEQIAAKYAEFKKIAKDRDGFGRRDVEPTQRVMSPNDLYRTMASILTEEWHIRQVGKMLDDFLSRQSPQTDNAKSSATTSPETDFTLNVRLAADIAEIITIIDTLDPIEPLGRLDSEGQPSFMNEPEYR